MEDSTHQATKGRETESRLSAEEEIRNALQNANTLAPIIDHNEKLGWGLLPFLWRIHVFPASQGQCPSAPHGGVGVSLRGYV